MNLKSLIITLVPLVILTGCVSVDEDAARAIGAMKRGDYAVATAWSDELAAESHYSKRLGEAEAGRVYMLSGDIEKSEQYFRKAVDEAIDRSEAQPKLKLTDGANLLLASTITDDRTRQYELQPYELNLALEYAILAQEALGKREDALADARLAVYVQDALAEQYGADIAKAEASANAQAKGICEKSTKDMVEIMAETRNSWENPVLWWLTGVLFEANGEYDQALQSYRKAAAIRSDNAVFAADVKRLENKKVISEKGARIVFVCGEGFVEARQGLKVPVPLYTMMSFDIPIYKNATYFPRQILVNEVGKSATAASPAINIQSLACRDLNEHLPGIVTRNLTRAATAAAAQAAVNHSGNQYAQLGVLAFNAAASFIRKADLRSWRTIPKGEQVWSAFVKPGHHQYVVSFGSTARQIDVDLKGGETKIIYVNSME